MSKKRKFYTKKASEVLDKSIQETLQSKGKGNFFKRLGKRLLPNVLNTALNFVPMGGLAKTIASGVIHTVTDSNNAPAKLTQTNRIQQKYHGKIAQAASKKELKIITKAYEKEISFID